jgi:hypothetical protein
MESFLSFFEKFTNGELPPVNRRRKILLESQYVYPSSGDKAVMDLYALYALWWDMGGGKQSSGYEQTNIRNHKIKEKIDRYFEEALVVISNTLLQESKDAIADEAENIFDEHLIPSQEVVKWFKENHLLPKLAKAYNDGKGGVWFSVFDYGETIHILSAPFWEEHANLYGGEKWATITRAIQQLDNALRRENVQVLINTFDKVMDLEHNTGNLYSKLHKMKVSKDILDLRAGFRSPKDFLPHVSPQVAKLIGLYRD